MQKLFLGLLCIVSSASAMDDWVLIAGAPAQTIMDDQVLVARALAQTIYDSVVAIEPNTSINYQEILEQQEASQGTDITSLRIMELLKSGPFAGITSLKEMTPQEAVESVAQQLQEIEGPQERVAVFDVLAARRDIPLLLVVGPGFCIAQDIQDEGLLQRIAAGIESFMMNSDATAHEIQKDLPGGVSVDCAALKPHWGGLRALFQEDRNSSTFTELDCLRRALRERTRWQGAGVRAAAKKFSLDSLVATDYVGQPYTVAAQCRDRIVRKQKVSGAELKEALRLFAVMCDIDQ